MTKPTRRTVIRQPATRPLVVLIMEGGRIQQVGLTTPGDVLLIDYDQCQRGKAPEYLDVEQFRRPRQGIVSLLDAAIDTMQPCVEGEAMDLTLPEYAHHIPGCVKGVKMLVNAAFTTKAERGHNPIS